MSVDAADCADVSVDAADVVFLIVRTKKSSLFVGDDIALIDFHVGLLFTLSPRPFFKLGLHTPCQHHHDQ